jgi:hypothetical protein
MKQGILVIAVVALVGCGKNETAQLSASNSATPPPFAETKAKAEAQLVMEEGAIDYTGLILFAVFVLLLFVGACWAFGFGKILNWIPDMFTD